MRAPLKAGKRITHQGVCQRGASCPRPRPGLSCRVPSYDGIPQGCGLAEASLLCAGLPTAHPARPKAESDDTPQCSIPRQLPTNRVPGKRSHLSFFCNLCNSFSLNRINAIYPTLQMASFGRNGGCPSSPLANHRYLVRHGLGGGRSLPFQRTDANYTPPATPCPVKLSLNDTQEHLHPGPALSVDMQAREILQSRRVVQLSHEAT
jgi:hypothetical protein